MSIVNKWSCSQMTIPLKIQEAYSQFFNRKDVLKYFSKLSGKHLSFVKCFLTAFFAYPPWVSASEKSGLGTIIFD